MCFVFREDRVIFSLMSGGGGFYVGRRHPRGGSVQGCCVGGDGGIMSFAMGVVDSLNKLPLKFSCFIYLNEKLEMF